MSVEYTDLRDDILDAIGELVNIVAGNAKNGLTEFNIDVSLPSVVLGDNHRIVDPKGAISFVVHFITLLGNFHMSVSLKTA